MGERLCVGIEYGDLDVRAAYAHGGVARVAPPVQAVEASIYFDPYANISSLGVGFPSILQSVGSDTPFAVGGHAETADSLVERRLAAIHRSLVETTGLQPSQSVIAVPAVLSQRRRRVLLGCAQRAGFGEASLIDAGAAAALGDHRDRGEASTSLVYRLDYGDCEICLVRLARGRCHIVGSAVLPRISGEMLDALVMESVVLALREKRLFLGLKQFSAQDWLEFRDAAERTRVALAAHADVKISLPTQLTKGDSALSLWLRAEGLATRVAPLVERTVDSVLGLLDQHELELANVDRFLLVGEPARTPPVSQLLARAFDGRPCPAAAKVVVLGALLQACRLVDEPVRLPSLADEAPAPGERVASAGAALARLPQPPRVRDGSKENEFVRVEEETGAQRSPASRPAVEEPAALPAPQGRLTRVRQLLEHGQIDEAEALLAAVAREVDELRGNLQSFRPTGAQLLIQRARALLANGQDLEAVGLSHKAYDEAPDDPQVFAAMMKIHADAGLALDKPEEYDRSLTILRCAHNHDQTDRSIHKALAERHLMHAMAMAKRNNLAKALEAVQAALSFEPKHPELNRLLRELTAEPKAQG